MHAVKLYFSDGRSGWLVDLDGELGESMEDAVFFETPQDVLNTTRPLRGIARMEIADVPDDFVPAPYRDRLVDPDPESSLAYIIEYDNTNWRVTPEDPDPDFAELAQMLLALLEQMSRNYGGPCDGSHLRFCLAHLNAASKLKLERGLPRDNFNSVVGRIY